MPEMPSNSPWKAFCESWGGDEEFAADTYEPVGQYYAPPRALTPAEIAAINDAYAALQERMDT
jgi:hypothetical protein